MQAGDLNRWISILGNSTTQDALGGLVPSWTPVFSCWAAITPLDGRGAQALTVGKETFSAGGGFAAGIRHKVAIRYTPMPLSAGMRVQYGSRIFTIQLLTNPNEANREIDMICLELTQ